MALGINGMGRIGRLALRGALGGVICNASGTRGLNGIEVAHLNEVKGVAETTAHLLEFDGIHCRCRANFNATEDTITVDNRRMGFTEEADPVAVPWGNLGCDNVLECTGKFRTPELLQPYFDQGVKKVVVVGLAIFGLLFAVDSSLHSYLILAQAGQKKAAEDVGFYCEANAGGRLMGTLLSGFLYQWDRVMACLIRSAFMFATCSIITFLLPVGNSATPEQALAE